VIVPAHNAGRWIRESVGSAVAQTLGNLEVMLATMRKFPDAALGLSWSVIDPPRPFPFRSSPRETQVAHYFGVSFLGVGPSASIILRTAFELVGGFSGRQFVGDTELWHRLTDRWPMVSLPPSHVWWRRHEGQQMSLEASNVDIINTRFNIEKEFLNAASSLDIGEKRNALERLKKRHARKLISSCGPGGSCFCGRHSMEKVWHSRESNHWLTFAGAWD